MVRIQQSQLRDCSRELIDVHLHIRTNQQRYITTCYVINTIIIIIITYPSLSTILKLYIYNGLIQIHPLVIQNNNNNHDDDDNDTDYNDGDDVVVDNDDYDNNDAIIIPTIPLRSRS